MLIADLRPGDVLEHMSVPKSAVSHVVAEERSVMRIVFVDGSSVLADDGSFELWWDVWRGADQLQEHTHCRESLRVGILKRREGETPWVPR